MKFAFLSIFLLCLSAKSQLASGVITAAVDVRLTNILMQKSTPTQRSFALAAFGGNPKVLNQDKSYDVLLTLKGSLEDLLSIAGNSQKLFQHLNKNQLHIQATSQTHESFVQSGTYQVERGNFVYHQLQQQANDSSLSKACLFGQLFVY